MKCILLFLSLVCSLSVSAQYCSEVWSPDNGDGTYTNPVINADYSDPDVVAVGDDYYLTASSFNCMPGLPILHSKDLVNWEIIVTPCVASFLILCAHNMVWVYMLRV